MKCDLKNRESIIRGYLLNELSEDENLKFEEHYFKCEECFNELRAAEDALTLIRNEGAALFQKTRKVKKESAKSFINKVLPGFVNPVRIGIAFATMAVVFFLLYVFYNLSSKKIEPIISDNGRDSVKQLVEQKQLQPEGESDLLANLTGPEFKLNPYYEEWMNETVRSGNVLIDKVISPKNNDKYSNQSVLFKWRMTEKIPVNLVIMNNEDDVVFSTKVSEENFPEYSISVSQKVFEKSGLYYWRIEDEIEVLYLGKFYFVKR